MADSHERSGGELQNPYAAEVAARNVRIVENLGQRKVTEVTKGLTELSDTHPELKIDSEGIAMAAQKEAAAETAKAILQRETGLMNDERSKKPGIFVTGVADWRALEQTEQELKMCKIDYGLEVTSDRGYTDWAYQLHLPLGAFDYTLARDILELEELGNPEYVRMCGRAEFTDGEEDFRALDGSLYLLTGGYLRGGKTLVYSTLGRVEGAGGTLWQNPNANAEGRPLQKSETAAA